MEALRVITGIAAPIMRSNVDTDQIVPSKELVRVHSEGYAASLFATWRYIGDRTINPDFLLNQSPWRNAAILLSAENFGCGSSREDAPKALRAFGIRVVIAPSFGGIFFNNCFRNGVLPVELPIDEVQCLAKQAIDGVVTVDLESQSVTAPDGQRFGFQSPGVLRQMMLAGVDEIDFILSLSAPIGVFRQTDRALRPWIY